MGEHWMKTWCEHCDEVNWIYMGDPEDLTVSDRTHGRCWSCRKEWQLFEMDDFDQSFMERHGTQYVEDGQKEPS